MKKQSRASTSSAVQRLNLYSRDLAYWELL